MNTTEEYLDLVDENDEVIGRKSRKDIYAEKLTNFRVVNAFIKNSEGKLWIPRRGPNKRIFPNCLDMSMGGHVESGETYNESFSRELAEELRINGSGVPWKLLGHLTPKNDGVSCFMNVYEISSNNAPDYNPDDYVSFEWLSPEELLQKIEGGEAVKSDLPILIKKLYI